MTWYKNLRTSFIRSGCPLGLRPLGHPSLSYSAPRFLYFTICPRRPYNFVSVPWRKCALAVWSWLEIMNKDKFGWEFGWEEIFKYFQENSRCSVEFGCFGLHGATHMRPLTCPPKFQSPTWSEVLSPSSAKCDAHRGVWIDSNLCIIHLKL